MTNKLWRYDSDYLLKRKYGLEESPTLEDLSKDYLTWVNHHQYNFIQNKNNGDVIFMKSCKRGNDVYAKKKSLDYDLVGSALSDSSFSTIKHRNGFRNIPRYGTIAYTRVLFVTFTYDTNLYTPYDAYSRVTSDINRWKSFFTKTSKIKYSSMCVKEGTDAGYPAPHMIIILDDPIPCVFFKGKYSDKWIVQNKQLVDDLHSAWVRASGGSFIVDIQGVVSGSMADGGTVAYYLSKYVGKAVKPDSKTSVLTLAMQKFFSLRDIISKQFWESLNVDTSNNRLDCIRNELKLVNKQILQFERENPDFHFVPPSVKLLYAKRDELKAALPPPEWEFIDSVTIFSKGGYIKDFSPVLDRMLHYNS